MRKAERKHLSAVADLGCILCLHLGYGATPAEIHHLRHGMGMGQRNSNYNVVPLCPEHHRGATGFHGLGRRAFERMYGLTELELLVMASGLLERKNPSTAVTVSGQLTTLKGLSNG